MSSLSYVVSGETARAATCTVPVTIPAAAGPPWSGGPLLAAISSRTAYQAGTSFAWGPAAVSSDTVIRNAATGVDAQSKAILTWYTAHDDVLREVNRRPVPWSPPTAAPRSPRRA